MKEGSNFVKRVVLAAGGNTRIARRFGIRPQCVSKWIAKGSIPIERVRGVSELSGIPAHELRPDKPDVFPPPEKSAASQGSV